MTIVSGALWVAIPLLLLPALLNSFRTFNRLVTLQQQEFTPQWVQAKCPSRWFDRTGNNRSFEGARAKYIYTLKWFFRTPAWARQNAHAMRLLWHYRLSMLVWNAGMLACILFFEMYIR
jgi:hypothetical protein